METKPQNRFRLAPKESPSPTFPTAGAMASNLFLAPVEGTTPLEALSEAAIEFVPTLSIGELSTLRLRTSGYDDPQVEVLDVDDAPEPEAPVPPMQSAPQQIKFLPKPPATAKIASGYDAIAPALPSLNRPRMIASTLRTRFALGANPNKPALKQPSKAAEEQAPAKAAPATPVAVKPVTATPIVSKPLQATPVQSKPAAAATVVKPVPVQPGVTAKPSSPQVTMKPPAAPSQKPAAAATVAAPPAAAAAAAAAKPAESPKPADPPKSVEAAKPAPPVKPVAEPAKPAADKPIEKAPERSGDKPKINVRPVQPPPQPAKRQQAPAAPARPAIAARDHGNAVPVEREEPTPAPPPSPKPKVQPIRPAAAPVHDVPLIGMPQDPEMGGFWSRASTPVKGIIVLVVAGVLMGGGYFIFRGGGTPAPVVTEASSTAGTAGSTAALPGAIIGGGGWSPNWGSEEKTNKGKQISLYRPTFIMADYSIVFSAQIEKKAIGWMFRAHDPKNYYVYKLKIVKPGVEPVLALEKFAVIDGKEDVHTQVMLQEKASLDTVWKIRTDVQGKKFTTYVQGKLADYMTDDRIKVGGAGFYNDAGEFAQIKNSAFYHLTYK